MAVKAVGKVYEQGHRGEGIFALFVLFAFFALFRLHFLYFLHFFVCTVSPRRVLLVSFMPLELSSPSPAALTLLP